MMNLKGFPTVSVIIPCRNEAKYIAQNIDSILNQDYPGKIIALIVDGFSDDGTREIVSKYQNQSGCPRIQ